MIIHEWKKWKEPNDLKNEQEKIWNNEEQYFLWKIE
jgi:hypothetical protein